ncbi:MAG: hypothetical protein DBY07_03665 [Clostridiales bacterium]|nr:MAG: hypothetical protein DBY07_03665 [Clostridiales bacterium]
MTSKRAADGGIAAGKSGVNGLMRADEPLAAAGIITAADIVAESRASQVETDGISACNKGSAYRKLYVERRGISPGGIAEV